MGLVINHNMPALYTSGQLDKNYSRLAINTQRLSSGLRINSSADDPAGFGIRELMRSELLNMEQGLRNAADGISLLQTAEGAMAIIDEKLIRMRELAEQASTGTYTTMQREIINSEYQAMAAEIDRIANATEFNGVKLLDGSVSNMHHGQGLKIHFGSQDLKPEDYYFVKIGDLRATSSTGLRVGGDSKNDIWSTTALGGAPGAEGCCGAGIPNLNDPVSAWTAGQIFSYGYNWDESENNDQNLSRGRYIGGAYQVNSGASLQSLLDSVNRGTQSRVRLDFKNGVDFDEMVAGNSSENVHRICLGNEVYYLGSATLNSACLSLGEKIIPISSALNSLSSAATVASAFALSVNNNSDQFWARLETYQYRSGYTSVYVFNKEGGNFNDIFGSDQRLGASAAGSSALQNAIVWHNDQTGENGVDGSYFGGGGQYWGTLKAQPTGYGTWGIRLDGRDPGFERDLWILNTGNSASGTKYDLNFYGYGGKNFGGSLGLASGDLTLTGLDRDSFVEIQNASDGNWAGASLRTQSCAQEALEAINAAIANKDAMRASLGAYMNRLSNTISNMETMYDTLQAAESRISDVDIATEMTDFVKNQVLSQAAVSILSQANALPEMALSLLNG